MSGISVDQRFAMLAKIGENIDWNSLTVEQVQVGVVDAQRAGKEATAFIRNGFRVQVGDFFLNTGELTIPIPALARLSLEEIQKRFRDIKGIERDTSPTEVVTLNLATILRSDEERVNGEEYERRIASKLEILFGPQQAIWLMEHQDEFPALMALLGKIYIDFSGMVVVGEDGGRDVFCLNRLGKRWDLGRDWVSGDFGRGGRLALSSK